MNTENMSAAEYKAYVIENYTNRMNNADYVNALDKATQAATNRSGKLYMKASMYFETVDSIAEAFDQGINTVMNDLDIIAY